MWNVADPSNGAMYRNLSQDSEYAGNNMASFGPHPQTAIDPNLMMYTNPLATMMGIQGQGDSPPLSSFAATGLPFPGLDYIRNYTPGVFDDGQEGLWQNYDGGEFRFDPDLPFSLGELSSENPS